MIMLKSLEAVHVAHDESIYQDQPPESADEAFKMLRPLHQHLLHFRLPNPQQCSVTPVRSIG